MTAAKNGAHGFDARVAHPARVYDYWLGGKDNFAADRIAGEETIAAYPAIRSSARANRAFLVRAVLPGPRSRRPAVPGHWRRTAGGAQYPRGRPVDRAGQPGH